MSGDRVWIIVSRVWQVLLGASPSAGSGSSFFGVLLGAVVLGVWLAASTLVRPTGGDHPLPSSSEASFRFLVLGVVWKSTRAG